MQSKLAMLRFNCLTTVFEMHSYRPIENRLINLKVDLQLLERCMSTFNFVNLFSISRHKHSSNNAIKRTNHIKAKRITVCQNTGIQYGKLFNSTTNCMLTFKFINRFSIGRYDYDSNFGSKRTNHIKANLLCMYHSR